MNVNNVENVFCVNAMQFLKHKNAELFKVVNKPDHFKWYLNFEIQDINR